MTDNIVKSEDVNPTKKSIATKNTTVKTKREDKNETVNTIKDDRIVVIFESGSSYSSGDVYFDRQNYIQEVEKEVALELLKLENFGLPNQIELEEFYASRGGK